MNVGFFGGSFNPPHIGHLLAVTYVLATEAVDRVLVVPAFDHPLGKTLVPFEHRRAMCEAAFAEMPRVEVSSIEASLGGASRTLLTLEALQAQHPAWKLRLIVGSDILDERDKWYRWDAICALAPPIVLGRLGHPHPEAPVGVLPEVASRELRAKLATGESVASLVPRGVLSYIAREGLYRG